MKKMLVLTFLLLLTMLTAPFTSALAENNISENARSVTVNVMTYNIHAGIGTDGKYDLDRIADTIKASEAEVIGLQEVDVHWGYRSNFDDEVEYLAEKLDMYAFYAPIYNQNPLKEGDSRRQYGVAVLSKHPITKAVNHDITRLSTQDENAGPQPAPGFAGVEVNAKGAVFSFYVTHLDYRSDPSIRQMQVDDMLDIIPNQHNTILVGDMNAPPQAPELQPLFERFQDADSEGNAYTFPATAPQKRIDYILTSFDTSISNTNVIPSLASDHLPVVSEVTLQRGK